MEVHSRARGRDLLILGATRFLDGDIEDLTTNNALFTVYDDGELCFSHDFQLGRTVYCSDLTSVAPLQEKLIDLGELIKFKVI